MYLLFLLGIFIYLLGLHGMLKVVLFAFSAEKTTPAGKKYASGAGGAGDKSQLCLRIELSQIVGKIVTILG